MKAVAFVLRLVHWAAAPAPPEAHHSTLGTLDAGEGRLGREATSATSRVPDPAGGMAIDCYLRTDIEPAKCGKDPRFELLQLLPNKTWSAPDTGVNCAGGGGGSAVHGAPEPFGLDISLARCERACEGYYPNCTGIIVTKPYNSSCLPSHVQSCPDLCVGAPTQCSAEICDLEPGQVSRLKPGTYYHDKQIFLPQGSGIIGAGINTTFIVACGRQLASGCNMTERRGFLMGDDTYARRQ